MGRCGVLGGFLAGRFAAVCGLVATLLLAGVMAAPVAHAHAALVGSDPADGAELVRAPSEVVLRFSEPVEMPPEAIRVFGSDKERVDDGSPGHGADRSMLRVGLSVGLPDDVYTVTWRAISADSHVVRGSLSFTVGDPGDISSVAVADLPGEQSETGWEAVAAGLRWLTYLGTLLAVGVTVFLLLVHDRALRERHRLVRLVRGGVVAAIAATVLAIPVQAVLASGLGAPAMVDVGQLGAAAGSGFGVSALIRVVGLAVLVAAVAWLWRRWAVGAAVAGALTALLSFLFAGHTVTTEPRWLVLGSNLAHTLAGSVWFGGLVALAVVLHGRRRAGADAAAGARLVARFSLLATVTVLVVVAGGVALGWAEIRGWRGLFTTVYGGTLLAKVVLVSAILAIGAYNNRRLVPAVQRGAERAWRRLSGTVRIEITGIVVVLAVTSVLVALVPGRVAVEASPARAGHGAAHAQHQDHAGGRYERHLELGPDNYAHVVVDPARQGDNEITVYLLSAAGRQADIAQEAELSFSLPDSDIAAITRVPRPIGPGIYRHSGPEMAIAGVWEVEIRVLVSDFEELTSTVHVPIG